MFSILLHCAPDEEDCLSAELWEAGTAGINDEPGGLRAFFEEGEPAGALLERFAAFTPELRREAPADWEQASRDAFPPLLVGERFYLVAPWDRGPTPHGRLRLEITPGMACGTGRHPATQLCLEAMERWVAGGAAVLDLGTGSGILSAAAELLGAGRVASCDIDFEAAALAARRLASPVFAGSADAVRSNFADVIVANISSAVIEELAPEFARVKRPGATLILSGFAERDLPRNVRPREILRRDEWICLVC